MPIALGSLQKETHPPRNLSSNLICVLPKDATQKLNTDESEVGVVISTGRPSSLYAVYFSIVFAFHSFSHLTNTGFATCRDGCPINTDHEDSSLQHVVDPRAPHPTIPCATHVLSLVSGVPPFATNIIDPIQRRPKALRVHLRVAKGIEANTIR